jgi:hypothetical protein
LLLNLAVWHELYFENPPRPLESPHGERRRGAREGHLCPKASR